MVIVTGLQMNSFLAKSFNSTFDVLFSSLKMEADFVTCCEDGFGFVLANLIVFFAVTHRSGMHGCSKLYPWSFAGVIRHAEMKFHNFLEPVTKVFLSLKSCGL